MVLGLVPITMALFFLLFSNLYKAWAQKLPFVVRQRMLFITIIPSTAFTLVFMMFTNMINSTNLGLYSLIASLAIIAIDAIIAYRGAFAKTNITGKIWRSIALSLSITITSLLAVTFAGTIAVFITTKQLF